MIKTITHKNDLPFFGADPLLEIATKKTFANMIFELLSGLEPQPGQSKIFETILNLSIDHGEETPSAVETIKAARAGKTISESVAAGVLQITNTHGGAIEPAMNLFYRIKKDKLTIKTVVSDYLAKGERMPGFGHRIYEVDPRSQLLFKLAEDGGLSTDYIKIAKEVETVLHETKGKALPVNIDGAIAAILCAFGWDPNLGKAVFIIARTPGLCGHYLNSI